MIHNYRLGFKAAVEDDVMLSLECADDLTISCVCRTLVRCTLVPDVGNPSSLAGESASAGGSLDFASFRLTSDKAEQTFR